MANQVPPPIQIISPSHPDLGKKLILFQKASLGPSEHELKAETLIAVFTPTTGSNEPIIRGLTGQERRAEKWREELKTS